MFVTVLLLICALGLSGVAAYYSIVGMASIFAGAFWPVVIMMSILEPSKLVVSSWLYQNWKTIPILIKTFFIIAVITLMGLTSLGIFGFLSKAHVDQGLGNTEVTLQIEQLDSKISSSKSISDRYETQLRQLDRAIDIQLDEKRGVLAGQERKKQEQERDLIRKKLDDENKTVQELQSKKTDLKQKISVIESKVGPIKYVAEFFSDGNAVDLDKAVRWLIIIIVAVFDPLAILMVIAANIGFKNWAESKKKDKTPNVEVYQMPISEPLQPVKLSPIMPDYETYRPPITKDEPRFVTNFDIPKSNINVESDLTTTPIIAQANSDDNTSNSNMIESIIEEPVLDTQASEVLNADEIISDLKLQHETSSKPSPKIATIGDNTK